MTNSQTIAEQIVAILASYGVEYVFGVPGEENEDFLFALSQSTITFVPTRHEQGAAFMANVWGRMTGRAGVCLSTLGPGATNLLTGLADAHLDKAPVVALTGQASSTRLHKESHQYIDVAAIFKPITKWNTVIQNPVVVAEAINKAFKIAETEKPGVTHIDLPEDIAALPAVGEIIPLTRVRRGAPDYKALAECLTLLGEASRPIILAGNGAIRKRASKQLRILSEKYNIPVISTFMGKGAVSDRAEQSLHAVGMKARDIGVVALETADLVITVGYDIAEYDPAYWNTDNTRPIVHIDFEQAEVYRDYQPTVEIVADISGTLWEIMRILDEAQARVFTSWYLPAKKAIEQDITKYATQKTLTVPWVLSQIRTAMDDTDVLLSDVGAHKMWIARNFPVYEPGTCVISNGLASMGIALPGGIATKLALPDRHVVSVMGDGGFMMNSQEIETAKRLGVGFTIIVLNDNDYGLISWKQTSHRGRSVGTKLTNPDFVAYAKSFGIKAYHPTTQADVTKVLQKVIPSNELTLITIDIDPKENMKLTGKLGKNLKFKM